jgi:hypothetical protein
VILAEIYRGEGHLEPTFTKASSDRANTFGETRETRLAAHDYTEALLSRALFGRLPIVPGHFLKVRRTDLAGDRRSRRGGEVQPEYGDGAEQLRRGVAPRAA